MSASEKCPRAEMVATLIDGELSRDERAVLEDHIAACPECYRVLTESTEVWWRVKKRGQRPRDEDESES